MGFNSAFKGLNIRWVRCPQTKDKRELDVIFSKMWSKNISNIFVKDSAVNHPVGLHPTLQSSVTPLRLQMAFVCMGTSPWVGTLFQQQRRLIRLLQTLLQGVCQFNTHLCLLCVLRNFQFGEKLETYFITVENACLAPKNAERFLSF